jgi:hypothetical protein
MHSCCCCQPCAVLTHSKRPLADVPTSRRRCSQPPLLPPDTSPPPAAAAAAAAAGCCGSALLGSPACSSRSRTAADSAGPSHQLPSMTAAAAGGRTQSPGGVAPSSTDSASIRADLPAPLVPLMAVRPGCRRTLLLDTSAKSRTDRACRVWEGGGDGGAWWCMVVGSGNRKCVLNVGAGPCWTRC